MKQSKNAKVYLIIGIILIVIAVPLYFGLKSLMCSNCRELSCAFCDLGAICLTIIEALFGIVLTVVSIVNFRKQKNTPKLKNINAQISSVGKKNREPKPIIVTTIRWVFIIIFLILGALSLYSAFVRFQYNTAGDGYGLRDIMRGIVLLILATMLIFWDKIFYKNK